MSFLKGGIFVVIIFLFFPFLVYPANAAVLPSGFTETTVVSGLNSPLAVAFLPDGRMLVTEQAGRVRLVVNGALQSTPLLDITGDLIGSGESGLLGMAVDPNFPTRPYIYLYYTNSSPAAQYAVRVTLSGNLSDGASSNLSIDVASRVYLLNDIPHVNSNHNGGTLRFGPDGMLYISVGDDGVSCDAQDTTVLRGEILRIKVDDTIIIGSGNVADKASLVPADNPFARSADANEKLVWAYGLRNPYRFTIDSLTGNLVIGDVGASSREEISLATAGGMNFGWPYWEGDQTYYISCGGVDGTMPIFAYDNPPSAPASVIGGPMYRGVDWPFDNSFPPEYEGVIFFSDVFAGFLKALKNDGSGNWLPLSPLGLADNNFGTGLVSSVAMTMGPDGAIYYVSLYGSVRKITYKNAGLGIAAMPDIDSSGSPELSVLMKDAVAAKNYAYVMDAGLGAQVKVLQFDANLEPLFQAVVPDVNSSGAPEIAMLGVTYASGVVDTVRVIVKDSVSGAWIKNIGFDKNFPPIAMAVVEYPSGHTASNVGIAVLGRRAPTGGPGTSLVKVSVRDAVDGSLITNTYYMQQFQPVAMAVVPDYTGTVGGLTNAPEIAVLGERDADVTWGGVVSVIITDVGVGAANNGWVTYIGLESSVRPVDLAVLPDMNANGSPEIAVLGVNRTNGNGKVVIREPVKNGAGISATINALIFPKEYPPLSMAVVPDMNGNGVSEIAVFGLGDTSLGAPAQDRTRVSIRDASASPGVWIGSLFYSEAFLSTSMVALDNFAETAASEIAVLGVDRNGSMKVSIKDASNAVLVNSFFVP